MKKQIDDRSLLIDLMKGDKPNMDEFNIYKGDVKTFQLIRTKENKLMEEQGLGGGNLTIALISVTVLGLIAKTYVILADKVCVNGQGDINETDAIQKLLRAKVDNWEYSDKEITEFWKRVRHKLIHLAYPRAVIVPDGAKSYEALQEKIKDEMQKPFSFDNNDILWVNCDVLWYQTMEIKEKIIKDLEEFSFQNTKIKEALKFIRGV